MSGQCICRRGYDRDVAGQCGDVNECLSGQRSVCGINAFCKNLPGSYDCVCPQVNTCITGLGKILLKCI